VLEDEVIQLKSTKPGRKPRIVRKPAVAGGGSTGGGTTELSDDPLDDKWKID
jgi:hypothetical protein